MLLRLRIKWGVTGCMCVLTGVIGFVDAQDNQLDDLQQTMTVLEQRMTKLENSIDDLIITLETRLPLAPSTLYPPVPASDAALPMASPSVGSVQTSAEDVKGGVAVVPAHPTSAITVPDDVSVPASLGGGGPAASEMPAPVPAQMPPSHGTVPAAPTALPVTQPPSSSAALEGVPTGSIPPPSTSAPAIAGAPTTATETPTPLPQPNLTPMPGTQLLLGTQPHPDTSQPPKPVPIIPQQIPSHTTHVTGLVTGGNYYVQIGAYTILEIVKVRERELEIIGLKPIRVEEGGLYRIRVGPYGSEAEARQVIDKINGAYGLEAFILAL